MTFDPRVQVSLDTDRANSRTFKRRDFVRPPRENYEDNAGQERNQASFSQPTIADEHFVDEIKVEPPEGGSGNLPDGYVETAVILCVNGSPVAGKILFKEDP